jgi:TonB dependent receptor/CarboxypepD_reg-like domain/TonB-dependent Receptor Plug Domain
MSKFLLLIISSLIVSLTSFGQGVTVSGYVREAGSLESIVGASVVVEGTAIGTITNSYGFYSLKINAQKPVILIFSMVGYDKLTQSFTLSGSTTFTASLKAQTQQLDEVTVRGETSPVGSTQMSVVQLSVSQIKQIPTLLGEKDVIKALQLLPGVQKGTEGSTALYVRGGGPDQNLILLDEAQVYNANHLFGFFSVFNGDAIKNVSFYKGGFPARYGGRLSSVIDLQMKDGNKQQLHGEGGIGLLSSRLTLEGPIQKGKSSFLVSGRRTYLDLLTKPLMPKEEKIGYRFYDFNAKLNFELNATNKLYVSGYFGNDALSIKENIERSTSTIKNNSLLGWGNATGTLRWNHLFSQKLFLNTTAAITDFRFRFFEDFERARTDGTKTSSYAEFGSAIRDYTLKADFDYFPDNAHSLKFGAMFTQHQFTPRAFVNQNRVSNEQESAGERYDNQEFGLYGEDTYQISNKLSANIGLRINGLRNSTKTYLFAEPRLSVGYQVSANTTLKASYSRNNQFVHLLSNTGVGLSTDLWVPATDKAPPQQADQIAVGLTKNFPKAGLNLTIESFRKNMRNIVAYREGASFLSFNDGAKDVKWEDNITTGRGWSYGTEILLQKNKGRLTGWLGYTLSWTIHQFDELNNGKRFFPRYDRRHDFSAVMAYKLSPKITLSANWVYATGNALTVPQGFYYSQADLDGNRLDRVDYLGSRNSFRAEAYHRLDLAVQFHKKKKWGERTWEVGFYNAYSRRNPLYYYLKTQNTTEGQQTILAKRSLFPIIPSVTYSFKF